MGPLDSTRMMVTRHRRLAWLVAGSLAMTLRNAWLAARGGGVTPPWMLRLETVSFAASATAGLCALTRNRRRTTAERVAVMLGSVGATAHGARLAIYILRRRTTTRTGPNP